jgi:hypothetical protein
VESRLVEKRWPELPEEMVVVVVGFQWRAVMDSLAWQFWRRVVTGMGSDSADA